MAKRKGGKSKGYISKGERPNVTRKILNELRRKRKADPALEDVFKSRNHRQRVISKPQNKKERELKDKYIEEDRIFYAAGSLVQRFGCAGLTNAGAVQAVKTDKVSELINKWKPRLSAWVQAQKKEKYRIEKLRYTGARI